MDTAHSILRSARSFFAGTALSRVTGLLRDMAMAVSFGSSPEIAAFMVAYRLANLFRRLLGEGNLPAGFIPQYIALKEKGPFFYRDVSYSMGVVLVVVVAVLEGILWGCSRWVGPDWGEIVHLSMWMVPGLFFICLYALNTALLQCQKNYFLPAVAPVMFNFIWIGAVFCVPGVEWLAIAITAAFVGQWFLTALKGWRLLSWKEWLRPRLFSPEFRALLKPLTLGIVGIGAVQINSACDALFARFADLQGPAFLWYAIRIQQLPLALFGIALSGALLPPLARAEDPEKRRTLLQGALRHSTALMVAATFGMFALARPGINLLYGHGDFSAAGVMETVRCLWGYAIGLVPAVFVLLLAPSFYAQKNYRTPTRASLLAVAANLGLNALFVFGLGWGAVSVAIATSLSAMLNVALLGKGMLDRSIWLFLARMGVVAAVPAAVVIGVQAIGMATLPRDAGTQLLQFGVLGGLYLAGVGAMAWKLGVVELFDLFRRKRPELDVHFPKSERIGDH